MSIFKLYGSAVGTLGRAQYIKGMLGAILFGLLIGGLMHIFASEGILNNFDARDFGISYTILACISFGLMQAKRLRAIGRDVRYIFIGVAFLILGMFVKWLALGYVVFALSLAAIKGQELDKQAAAKETFEDRRTRRAKFKNKYK